MQNPFTINIDGPNPFLNFTVLHQREIHYSRAVYKNVGKPVRPLARLDQIPETRQIGHVALAGGDGGGELGGEGGERGETTGADYHGTTGGGEGEGY
eukprot:CAMPEP_0182493840 /NCGR_PEP_ID=MMETSP1321-20130603/2736_1 /TAXON_ID=91990 /ORGANISM="Bolidomonas sp., Strain RCC1657" /LENGTH=96 /DNA_ID=CAMNT_0024696713 /DNA_START=335 /DNA_END=625 /DNA_ORIENTATION=+